MSNERKPGWSEVISAELKAKDERIAELEGQLDWCRKEVEARSKSMREQGHELLEARSRLGAVEAELDEASPMRTCARCGKQDRSHRMAIEEGDEWECFPCWERCNAQEREAAKMLDGAGPGQLAPVVEGHDPELAPLDAHGRVVESQERNPMEGEESWHAPQDPGHRRSVKR